MDRQALLQRYADNLSNSTCRNQYIAHGKHFLDNSSGIDRESVDRYIAALQEEYRPGYVNVKFRAIRRLFNVNGLPWPYRRGEAPLIKERDEYRPQLSVEIVEAIIMAAKGGRLFPYEQCFVALATTYGLRRVEMISLRPQDVNLDNSAIFISTAKFGRERYHLLPEEIKPYLEAHDFDREYSLSLMTVTFNRIVLKATKGQVNIHPLGWHSVRRALYDGLVTNGVNMLDTRRFMRWKSASGEMAMPARYHGNVVVGMGTKAPVLNEAQKDKEIFELHPFLPFWREE